MGGGERKEDVLIWTFAPCTVLCYLYNLFCMFYVVLTSGSMQLFACHLANCLPVI